MSKIKRSEKVYKKVLIVSTVLIMFQGFATALSGPNTTQIVSTSQEVNFTVYDSEAENVTLRLQPPKQSVKTFNLKKDGNTFKIGLQANNFTKKGRYLYSFVKQGKTFPQKNNFSLTVSSKNETLENRTLNVSDTESQIADTDFCDYKTEPSDFHCEAEHYQAGMILSSAIGLYLNESSYEREKFQNFTFGNYGNDSSIWSTCDHTEPDFNCNNITADEGASSGAKQGSLIFSLWEAYQLTGNESVKDLAMNYTEGSAETCNVWNNSFNCSTGRSQALMALGYWSAYDKTGNTTFKSIAENLTTTNHSHPLIPSAYLQGHVYTSNSTFLSEAEKRTRKWLEDCPNCSSDEINSLKNTLWNGYRVTGEYGYYRNAVNLTSYSNGKYCSWNSSSCKNPYIQGLSTYNYWRALKAQKDLPESIFNPQVEDETVVGENLTVKVELEGQIHHPELLYRNRTTEENSWNKCQINFFDGCEIPGENISKQAPYSYKFNSSSVTFPENGSFSFSPSLVKNTFIDEANSFSENDPDLRCAPSEGDFACEDRNQQAPMIEGFTELLTFNASEKSGEYFRKILERPYVTQEVFDDDCTPKNDYMSCERGSDTFGRNIEGSVRQGRMIKSLFSAYQSNREGKTYQRAMNYTLGAAKDCDVWKRTYQQSFNCGSTKGQAEMIEAYLKAYEVTANLTFRNKALNLTEEAVKMNESSELGSALWKASSQFNETYRSFNASGSAENISDSFTGYCIGNCSVEQYLGSSNLFRDAFLYSKQDYSNEYRSSVLNTTEDGECGPYKQDTSCSYPSAQGEVMQLMWGSAYTMPVEIKVEDKFNISKETLTVGSQLSTTCSAQNNLENTTIKNLEFEISTGEGLETVSNNTTYATGNLEYDNSSQVSWDLDATSVGKSNASCSITSDSGYRDTINREITVEAQETEDGGKTSTTSTSSEPSSSVDFGGFGDSVDDKSLRNQTISYKNFSSLSWDRTLLDELGINITYRNFSRSSQCFTSERKIIGENITLEVNSSCQADGAVLLDEIPSNTTLIEGRSVNGLTVARSPELTDRTDFTLKFKGRNTSEFKAPLVLVSDFSLPPVNMTEVHAQQDGSSGVISANLNREASCTVFSRGEKVYTEDTDNLVYQPDLDYGNNTYRVRCGDQTFTKTFTREKIKEDKTQEDQMDLPLSLFIGVIFITLTGLTIRYRKEIISEAEMKIFEYRFNSFETAIEKGNTAEAIEAFDSMSRDISQEVLESDMDLMQGMMLYLLIDLVEEGKDDEVAFDVSDDLDDLVQRYMDNSDGKAVRLVREKFEEAIGREM